MQSKKKVSLGDSLAFLVLYVFQSVYITVWWHKRSFYVAFMKYFWSFCASHVSVLWYNHGSQPISACVTSQIFYNKNLKGIRFSLNPFCVDDVQFGAPINIIKLRKRERTLVDLVDFKKVGSYSQMFTLSWSLELLFWSSLTVLFVF